MPLDIEASKDQRSSVEEFVSNEYITDWRNLIFLPFHAKWSFVIHLTILLASSLTVYDVVFERDLSTEYLFDYVYYTCEILFIIDTILSIMHRNMVSHRIQREHMPLNIFALAVNVVTLVPIYEVYVLLKSLSRHKSAVFYTRDVTRLKVVVRLYRVFFHFHNLSQQAGINQVYVITIAEIFRMYIITFLLAAVWYILSCWQCKHRRNWTEHLIHFDLDPDSSLDWYLLCFMTMGCYLVYNFRGSIHGVTVQERFVIIFTMLGGYLMHAMYYLGCLTEAMQKYILRQYIFERRLILIFNILDDWKISKSVKDRTLQYYNTLWEKRTGIYGMPKLFKLLPLPLQKEVTLDIFWEALRHSHLFRDRSTAFKRALSLEMECEMYLPGDYVFRLKQMKDKMVYIVSGVIQILTEEDEESPIMSFSNGSLLSEISVLLPTESMAYVRCATYCEVQTLSFSSLFKVLLVFPELTQPIKDILFERIMCAGHLMAQKRKKKLSTTTPMTKQADTAIQWLKKRWRQLIKLQQQQKKLKADALLTRHVDHDHTSKNLDMLVLSDDFELKTKAICINATCPFVLESSSSFRRCCGYVILGVILLQSVMMPYMVFIAGRVPGTMAAITMVFDVVYLIDIYLQISTAVNHENQLIARMSDIAMYKLKKFGFLVDIAATLPLNMLARFSGATSQLAMMTMCNRVLKIYRVMLFIFEKEKQLLTNFVIIRVLKYIFMSLMVAYWGCCIIFYLSCPGAECKMDGMLMNNAIIQGEDPKVYKSISYAVDVLFSYIVSLFSHLNMSNVMEYTIMTMMSAFAIILSGSFLTIFFTAELTASFYVRYQEMTKYNNYIRAINRYLAKNKIDPDLRKQVSEVLQFQWYYNENTTIVGKKGILNDAPDYLKDIIVHRRIINCLASVPLFSQCGREVLNKVAAFMIFKVLPPGALVTAADNRSRWMHCIVRGYCTQHSIMPGDKERGRATILKSGDSFPVVEMMHEVLVLTNVRTLTAVEVISIPLTKLEDIFHANTEFEQSIRMALSMHLELFEKSLLRKSGRLPEMVPVEKNKARGEFFRYQLMDEDLINYEKEMYNRPFNKLGKWGVLRYLLLNRSIDPTHRYFKYYEWYRFALAILVAFTAITYNNVLIQVRWFTDFVLSANTFLGLIDFYVRMHCQYYNEEGILVTHPWSTALHYFKTSFAVDLWCILPVSFVDEMFGLTNKQDTFMYLVIMTRSFATHRLISYLSFCQSDIEAGNASLIQSFKYSIVGLEILAIAATCIQLYTCTIRREKNGVVVVMCPPGTWLHHSLVKDYTTPHEIFTTCLYVAVTLFTTTAVGEVVFGNVTEIFFFITIFLILFLGKMFFFTKLLGSRVGGNVNLTIYQERVRSFEKFIASEMVDEELAATTIEHYQYKWKRDHGNEISKSLNEFHPQLHEDITFNLFANTLKAVECFDGADDSFFRLIGVQLTEAYFKKDADIVRCNDVQNLIYFVHRGRVDVLVAKTKLCTMGQGSIFGCLSKTGKMRQTISVKAKVHVVLLTIDSIVFHKNVSKYHLLYRQVQQANFSNAEFLESRGSKPLEADETHSQSLTQRTKMTASLSRSTITTALKYSTINKYLRVNINPDGSFYRTYHYIMCVHVASITVLWYLYMIFLKSFYQKGGTYGHILTGLIDLLFYSKIYVGFHLSYKDAESGIKVRDFGLIARRYGFSVLKFWFDLFTCIPFEYILMFTVRNDEYYWKLGWMNRVLRLKFLYDYYNEKVHELTVRAHLRVTYPLYMMLIVLQLMTALWSLIACHGGAQCGYIRMVGEKSKQIQYTSSVSEAMSIMYGFVVTMLTTTGLRDVIPYTIPQLMSCIVMAFLFLASANLLASSFTTISLIRKFTMKTYDYAIEDLRIYLQGRSLSSFIFNKVWKYYLQLWTRQSGEWMPALITEAPSYLRQDLMYCLYGYHIETHVLFSKTHMDFIRQLVTHMKRCVFFPGNYIVEKGDIDHCMYFIHDGEVDVVEKIVHNQMPYERLLKGKSFGVEQGLLRTPHQFFYMAHTVVDAVMLRLDDWEYLLYWFPASRQQIWRGAMELGIKISMSHKNTGYLSTAKEQY